MIALFGRNIDRLLLVCLVLVLINGIRGDPGRSSSASVFSRSYKLTQATKQPKFVRNKTTNSLQNVLDNQPRDPLRHDNVPLIRLIRDILSPTRYDTKVRPILNHSIPLKIHISMSLYQLIDVNEPRQFIKLNMWMIQEWVDEMLDWNPEEYDMINSTILPHNFVWIPDTYLYNSVIMQADETERYMNIKATSRHWEGKKGAHISFLYPAIYTITCRLNIRYFPYDQQNCTLTISSWTNSKSALDYYANAKVSMANFIRNEEWEVVSFNVFRHEYKYACCAEPWVILEASIVIRRKPLYYVVNLIIPTSIITLVSITGFFTPASTADDRTEKINLGITTLLAMSILMLMISDQMPTTSDFIPLIAWFYLSIIIIISIGTFLTSVILSIQGRRQYGKLPPLHVRYWFFVCFTHWLCVSVPPPLSVLWDEMDDHPADTYKKFFQKRSRSSSVKKKSKSPSLASARLVIEKQPVNAGPRLAMPESPSSPATLRPNSLLQPGSRRATANWLKVGTAAINSTRSSRQMSLSPLDPRTPTVPMIALDISTPDSPASASMNNSRRPSQWDNAIASVALVSARFNPQDASLRGVPAAISQDVMQMKQKRQCSLEWEFLATILDRLFLILFIVIVLLVTLGMTLTGRMAQLHYDVYNVDT